MLYAGAAIGVSHLVQSTRAGADFGFELMWILLLANILKYPFFEVAGRYVHATGYNLIDAYRFAGKWVLVLFGLLTLLTMFPIQAAVTMVTAGLAINLTGLPLNPLQMSILLIAATILILISGKYRTLDGLVKFIILVLTLSTVTALVAASLNHSGGIADAAVFDFGNRTHIYFLIAFIGWMPAPIDVAVWSSLWNQAKMKQLSFQPSLEEVLREFRIGYFGTMIIAAVFLALGALVLHGTDESLSANGAVFAGQLISLYTGSIGWWAYPVISIAAFTTMFSTTITVTDAYPRVLGPVAGHLFNRPVVGQNRFVYILIMLIVSSGALYLIYRAGTSMRFMVDLATSLSFVTAPILAVINYRIAHSSHMPVEARPGLFLKIWAWVGIVFLVLFTLYYLLWLVMSYFIVGILVRISHI
jgi:Mn2+/Fe2+ NRAMP family transporter